MVDCDPTKLSVSYTMSFFKVMCMVSFSISTITSTKFQQTNTVHWKYFLTSCCFLVFLDIQLCQTCFFPSQRMGFVGSEVIACRFASGTCTKLRRCTRLKPSFSKPLGTICSANPEILLMAEIRLTSWGFSHYFIGFHTSQVVQDFSHQQYWNINFI